jgi:ParB/RepB/Spo0J family partition protein
MAGALIGIVFGPIEQLARDKIDPDPGNPRQKVSPKALASLTSCIRATGILSPLVVTPSATPGRYDLLDGYLRWLASGAAGLDTVPVIVISQPLSPAQRLQFQLITSLQRVELKPCSEEAAGYEALITHHGFTQTQLAPIIGYTDTELSRVLRLRLLPPDIQALVDKGQRSKTAALELAKGLGKTNGKPKRKAKDKNNDKDDANRQLLYARFRREALTRDQITALREVRERKSPSSSARPVKRAPLSLPYGATITVTCPDNVPELTSEVTLCSLEFAVKETRKAIAKANKNKATEETIPLPVGKLRAHFERICKKAREQDAVNGHADAQPSAAADTEESLHH